MDKDKKEEPKIDTKSKNDFGKTVKDFLAIALKFVIVQRKYFISSLVLLLIIGFMASSTTSLRLFPKGKIKTVKSTVDKKNDDTDEEIPKIELPEAATNPLILNEDKELNKFIKEYYKAIENADIDEIRKHVDVLSDIEINSIKLKAKAREAHKNIKVYTKNGPETDSYLAYVALELKFKDIKTLAPGIEPLYIKKDSDGYVIINSKNSSSEDLQYTNEAEETEDVVELFARIDDAYKEACSKDNELVKLLKENGYPVPEVEAEKDNSDKDTKTEVKNDKKAPETAEKPETKPKTDSADKPDTSTSNTNVKSSSLEGKSYILTDGIRIRAKKSITADVNATAIKDDSVTIIKEYKKGGWVKVKLNAAGQEIKGYMKKDVLLENAKLKK